LGFFCSIANTQPYCLIIAGPVPGRNPSLVMNIVV
jgi:hypothetical protein